MLLRLLPLDFVRVRENTRSAKDAARPILAELFLGDRDGNDVVESFAVKLPNSLTDEDFRDPVNSSAPSGGVRTFVESDDIVDTLVRVECP